MKDLFFVILLCVFPFFALAQSNHLAGRFGLEINSGLSSEIPSIRLGPSLTYLKGKNQFNLGLGFAPSASNERQVFSVDYRNKYFLNGMDKKYSLYLTNGFSFVRKERDAFFNTTHNYLFFDVGYGFQVNVIGNIYLGTNISAGPFSYHRYSENPIDEFAMVQLFQEWGFHVSGQFNLGYRF
ncbi:MAG: hypothetical protein AAF927_17850 [Bacteroidota bacterium]